MFKIISPLILLILRLLVILHLIIINAIIVYNSYRIIRLIVTSDITCSITDHAALTVFTLISFICCSMCSVSSGIIITDLVSVRYSGSIDDLYK